MGTWLIDEPRELWEDVMLSQHLPPACSVRTPYPCNSSIVTTSKANPATDRRTHERPDHVLGCCPLCPDLVRVVSACCLFFFLLLLSRTAKTFSRRNITMARRKRPAENKSRNPEKRMRNGVANGNAMRAAARAGAARTAQMSRWRTLQYDTLIHELDCNEQRETVLCGCGLMLIRAMCLSDWQSSSISLSIIPFSTTFSGFYMCWRE